MTEFEKAQHLVAVMGMIEGLELEDAVLEALTKKREMKEEPKEKITVEDCRKLWAEFDGFCESAEGKEHAAELLLVKTLTADVRDDIDNMIRDQKLIRAMFAVHYSAMGNNEKAKEYDDGRSSFI